MQSVWTEKPHKLERQSHALHAGILAKGQRQGYPWLLMDMLSHKIQKTSQNKNKKNPSIFMLAGRIVAQGVRAKLVLLSTTILQQIMM